MRTVIQMRLRVMSVLPLLAAIALFGCRDFKDRTGSSGLAEGPHLDVSGTWKGVWNTTVGSGDAGTVRFELNQESDGSVFGASFWTGSPCWDDGRGALDGMGETFSGSVEGSVLGNPTLVNIPREPNGVPNPLANTRVTGRLEIIGDLMTGTFTVSTDEPARCTDNVSRRGDRGTLELTRQ